MKYIKHINEYFDDYDQKKKHSDYNLKDFDQPLRSYDIKINKDKKSNYVHIDLMLEQYIDSLKYFKLVDRKEEEGFYTIKYLFDKKIEDLGNIIFEIEIHKMMTSYFVIFYPKFTPKIHYNSEILKKIYPEIYDYIQDLILGFKKKYPTKKIQDLFKDIELVYSDFKDGYIINLEGEDDNIWKFKVNDEVKNEKYFPVILKKINKNIWYLSKYFEDKYSVEIF